MNGNKNAVFILLGQSNAVGHGLPMREEDRIRTPLRNVFGLDRKQNQSFSNTELVWSGYTSAGMNLAEEQDDTYSIANCLAALWQGEIDGGNPRHLPDLCIVQIAIGAQGVSAPYMWYPDRPEKLVPGPLGTVDISLFPFSTHVFGLLEESFARLGETYEILGLHWRGGEEDVLQKPEDLRRDLEPIYKRIFGTFNRLLGDPPTVLHRIVCEEAPAAVGPGLENLRYIDSVFDHLGEHFSNVTVLDPRTAPQFLPEAHGNGLFCPDMVHFTPEVNRWIAQTILDGYADV